MRWYQWGLLALVLVPLAVGLGLLLQDAEYNRDRTNFTEGFCAALHGSVLNNDACNVDGMVVEVPK